MNENKLVNLKEDQYILIDKLKYKILNGIKYKEKSSYWMEYKLQNLETGQIYYLNVELSKVQTYFGMTDIGLNEEVSYYEYTSKKDKNEILSIEKWKDEVEISIGKNISLTKIKILNEFEY